MEETPTGKDVPAQDDPAQDGGQSRADRFASRPGELTITQCIYCTRWHVGGGRSTCDAFPQGVPREIIRNQFDHREPHPGDNGLQFEAREGASYSTR